MTDDKPQRKMRVLIEREIVDNIHNDLSNTAHYFKKRVLERLANDDRDGIFLEMMATLTMTAFAFEANLNFLGMTKNVPKWRGKNLDDKLTTLLELFGLTPNMEERPYSTVGPLKKLRNTLAHGKPRTYADNEIFVGTYDEAYKLQRKETEWEAMVNPEFMTMAYDDTDQIWHELLAAAQIEVWETISGQGMHGLTLIDGDIDPDDEV